jgi:RsiW-degrading membrane proteinase PrsW (M82 family)
MGFMNFAEWREFARDITAGIFGGLVVAMWQLSYELLEKEEIWIKILVPSLISLIFFFLMILFLRWLFLKKDESELTLFKEEKTKLEILRGHEDWQRAYELRLKYLDKLSGLSQKIFITLITFFGALTIALISKVDYFIELLSFLYFSLILLGIIILECVLVICFISNFEKDVKKEYNKLFVDLCIGKIRALEEISNNYFKKITENAPANNVNPRHKNK